MSNRLYTAAVILLWLGSMTWLVRERILPPFFGGDAPATRLSNQVEPVAWRIEMDGRSCGDAVLQAVRGADGTKEVHSVLRLKQLRAPSAAPVLLAPLLKSLSDVSLQMRTRTTYDSFDRLAAFHTDMTVDHIETKIEVTGRVREDTVALTVRVGGLTKRSEHAWPSDAQLGGEMTPAARLLPLYEGRRWSQEVYSPFASPKQPLELIEAVVTERLRPMFAGKPIDAWRVEYRSTDKTGSTDEGRLRAVLFVAEDGRVLQQEINFLGSKVLFTRLGDGESQLLADKLLELEQRATVRPSPSVDAKAPAA